MTTTHTASERHAVGSDELVVTLEDVTMALSSLRLASSCGSVEGWAEVVRVCQTVVNMAVAVQHAAIVALCAIETVEDEDGTPTQWHRAAGHVSLDGPAIVSTALNVTAVHAERRVRDAVRLAADGPAGTSTSTGLGGLHEAMRTGTLDAYRAGVVADELEEAPAEVAETIIATLGEHLGAETAPLLRRRTRRLVARISPDLLRQRAKRAREQCGLRRWVDEPGVDRWEGTFPSEDAAAAWAAIDARAHQLLADGTHQRVERARAQALVDLVTGNATITTIVTLTVPADQTPHPDPDPITRDTRDTADAGDAGVTAGTAHEAEPAATTADRGTSTNPAPSAGPPPSVAAGPAAPTDLLQVPNPLGGEPMLIARAWLDALLTAPTTTIGRACCDPVTGALRSGQATTAYRPPRQLAALVRRRDGRCRFPGCSVAARFCDLDHVRPWPAGPTTGENLICLCRRHHRVKQRPGWRATLHPDATITWTDPTGTTRTTQPVDALHGLVLPASETEVQSATEVTPRGSPDQHTGRVRADRTDTRPDTAGRVAAAPTDEGPGPQYGGTDAFSRLEFALEHLLGATPIGHRPARAADRTSVQLVRTHGILVDSPTGPCRTRPRHRPTSWGDDPPPF